MQELSEAAHLARVTPQPQISPSSFHAASLVHHEAHDEEEEQQHDHILISQGSVDTFLGRMSPPSGEPGGELEGASSAPLEQGAVPPGDSGDHGPLQWQQHSAYRCLPKLHSGSYTTGFMSAVERRAATAVRVQHRWYAVSRPDTPKTLV